MTKKRWSISIGKCRLYLNKFYVLKVGSTLFTRAMLASTGISCCHMSVCPSICHKSVFCWNS